MAQTGNFDPRIGMVAARLEHLNRIHSYGIERVELVILPREEERAVREYLEHMQPRLSVHCPLFRDGGLEGYPLLASLFDTDAERQECSLRVMEWELQQASDWGATYMVVHLQRSVGVLGEDVPGGWDETRALDVALRAGERLARAAERAHMPLHIENMMSHPLFCRPESYEAFFAALPPSISMCFDIGHAALDAAKYQFDTREFAALLAPRIGSLHVYNNQVDEDFDFQTLREQGRIRKHPVHPSQTVERGWIDIVGIVEAVLSCNPQALVTFEVYFALDTDRDETQRGLQWLDGVCRRHWGGHHGAPTAQRPRIDRLSSSDV